MNNKLVIKGACPPLFHGYSSIAYLPVMLRISVQAGSAMLNAGNIGRIRNYD